MTKKVKDQQQFPSVENLITQESQDSEATDDELYESWLVFFLDAVAFLCLILMRAIVFVHQNLSEMYAAYKATVRRNRVIRHRSRRILAFTTEPERQQRSVGSGEWDSDYKPESSAEFSVGSSELSA